jgi:hypothetical protein
MNTGDGKCGLTSSDDGHTGLTNSDDGKIPK